MKRLLSLTAMILLSLNLHAAEYTTMNDGSWSSMTTWSTDGGVTPCNCIPSLTVAGNTININHNITINNPLIITDGSLVNVSATGSIYSAGQTINVQNGQLLSEGDIEVNKLIVDVDGLMYIHNSLLTLTATVDCFGSFEANFVNIIITGNIDVSSSGSFVLTGSSKLYFITGNFDNSGYSSFCSTCCMQLGKGNITNHPGGTFDGSGSMISDLGNIKNYGAFSPTIRWCAIGQEVGLITPEDCAGANVSCLFVPLPSEKINFALIQDGDKMIANWDIESESNVDYYVLESTIDGYNWKYETTVDSESNGVEVASNSYSYTDFEFAGEIVYYRLKQVNNDGEVTNQRIKFIHPSYEDLSFFPNPTLGEVNVVIDKNLEIKEAGIYSIQGQLMEPLELRNGMNNIQFGPNYSTGIYFVKANVNGELKSYKIVKR